MATLEERAAARLAEIDKPAASVAFRRLSDVEARPVRWLWPGRIARGKVTVIAGHPGLGKSQITASMAAIVTTGGRWPVDRTQAEIGNVVMLSAEDDAADTIRPRLEAAGADIGRVYLLDAIRDMDGEGRPIERGFNLVTDLERLGDLLDQIGDVAAVVIDPISAYLGGADSHKNAEIRALLAPLAKLAECHQVAVLCVSHLNKGGGSEALSRVTGSLAFVAAARAVYIVAKDQESERRRLFLPAKNNVGNDTSGLAFCIESVALGPIETSRVSWEAEPVTISADEVLTPEGHEERTERREAEDWLRDILADGPLAAKTIQQQAKDAGLAWITVRRAKDRLGIKPVKTRFDGGWEWALPEDAQDAQSPGGEHLRGAGASSTESSTYNPDFGVQNAQSHEDAHPRGVSTFGDDWEFGL